MSLKKEKWGDVKTKNFILSYLRKTCLWNTTDSAYSQKTNKQQAYEELKQQFEFDSVNEVRNKIRIFRTTYMQEKRKEETVENYVPKLIWYEAMKSAFEHGKAKSFSKFHVNKSNTKKESILHVQYEDSPDEPEQEHDQDQQSVKVENNESKNNSTQIIIEPYEDEDEIMEEYQQPISYEIQQSPISQKNEHPEEKVAPQSTESQYSAVLSSNELFLQSLKIPLDKMSFEKNMWVRCKIQELVYKAIYEKP